MIGRRRSDVPVRRDVQTLVAVLRAQRRGGARRRSQTIEQVSDELAEWGGEAVGPLLEQLDHIGTPACVALARIGVPAIAPMTDQLARGHTEHRRLLVRALGLMGSAETVVPVRSALSDPDPEVARAARLALERHAKINVRRLASGGERDEAMRVLEAIGEPAVWPLANVLRDPRLGLFAARVLGHIGAAAVEPVMVVFVESARGASWDERPSFSYATAALKGIGAPALDALLYLLYDRSEGGAVRTGAAEALGAMGAVAVPALLEALEVNEPFVRQQAALALGDVGASYSRDGEDPFGAEQFRAALEAALGDESAGVRAAAAAALARLRE